MKLNQRQRELAESALQVPEWREDRRASWVALGIGALLVGLLSGPTTALVCIVIAFAAIILFSVEPLTGVILLVVAFLLGLAILEPVEAIFALAYLVFTGGIGLFWIYRNIRYENIRAESLEERAEEDE